MKMMTGKEMNQLAMELTDYISVGRNFEVRFTYNHVAHPYVDFSNGVVYLVNALDPNDFHSITLFEETLNKIGLYLTHNGSFWELSTTVRGYGVNGLMRDASQSLSFGRGAGKGFEKSIGNVRAFRDRTENGSLADF